MLEKCMSVCGSIHDLYSNFNHETISFLSEEPKGSCKSSMSTYCGLLE